MCFKKSKAKQSSKSVKSMESQEQAVKKEESGNSPLLERYLQKTMTDHMRNVDDEALAKAIQTLLYEDKDKNKHLN